MEKIIRHHVALGQNVSSSDQYSAELEVRERMRTVEALGEQCLCDWDAGAQQDSGSLCVGIRFAIHTVQHILYDFMIGGELVVLVMEALLDEFFPAQR